MPSEKLVRDQPNSSVIGSSSKPSAIMGNTVEPKSVPTMIAAATLGLRGRNRIRPGTLTDATAMFSLCM